LWSWPKCSRRKQYKSFADSTAASITLTFKQIEDIIGADLPSSSNDPDWWYPRWQSNRIAEAWVTEGYTLKKVDTEKKKAAFHRDEEGLERLVIPPALLSGKIPANAVFELETHMEYIINEYLFSTLIKCKECGWSFRRTVRTYKNTYVRPAFSA
jgi:hypothetical protein